METKNLEERIRAYNQCYREGNPIISDAEYDALVEELKVIDPDNDFFKKSIIEENKGERMEKLPLPMFSLNKVKSIDELIGWIKSCIPSIDKSFYLTFTPKYDGISLLYDENTGAVWTRGNGIEGQRSDEWGKKMGIQPMKNYPVINQSYIEIGYNYTWGEAIISKKNFKEIQTKTPYKTARNLVAGLFNANEPNELLKYVDFVRYGGVNKQPILESLKQLAFGAVNKNKSQIQAVEGCFDEDYCIAGWCGNINELNSEKLNERLQSLYKKWGEEYNIDGIVIHIGNISDKEGLDEERLANGNPKHKIAFKDPAWSGCVDTTVKGITWKISKDGKAKPVINVEPVEIGGVTISNVTGYNAKYIIDNHIAEESVIRIMRSGDVIPKHIATLRYDKNICEELMDDMIICHSCGESLVWDETYTELVCKNPNCREKVISKMVYGFATLGCKEFSEPTVIKLYEAGYTDILYLLNFTVNDLKTIDGIGEALAKTMADQFYNIIFDGVPFSVLITALNYFEGKLGVKICQKVIDDLSREELDDIRQFLTVERCCKVEGVDVITAKVLVDGINRFLDDYGLELFSLPISYFESPKVEASENQMVVCMSGFRDVELADRLVKAGHKVVDGINKNVTHLIVKSMDSSSSKTKKAVSLGIKIVTREDFDF